MPVLAFPYPGTPPPAPFLAPDGDGWRYDHVQTMVRAEIRAGTLTTPVPRAAFHARELAGALRLAPAEAAAFDEAWERAQAEAPAGAPRLARALGLSWWRYTMARGALRAAWPAIDIVVPDLLLFARRDSGAVTTVLVWPEDVRALIIPEAAEHVVLRPDPLRARGPTAGAVLLPRAAVEETLAERAIAHPGPVPYRVHRGGAGHPFLFAALRRSAGEPARAFRAVRADEVIDEVPTT
jgi:hypothetical protein